ncbi:MAG TPA: BON domain-containing protein [Clostridia bacterium]|nr:BON domain-containing protein [Clostridia bacterium]
MKLKNSVLLGGLALSMTIMTGCQTWKGGTEDRTEGRKIDDQEISKTVQRRLKEEPVYKFTGVDVKTYQGVVQLSGFVDTEVQRDRAAQVAQTVPGIREVMNHLAIKPEPLVPTGTQQQHQYQQQQQPAPANR